MGGHVAVEDDDVIVEDDEKPGKYVVFHLQFFQVIALGDRSLRTLMLSFGEDSDNKNVHL